MFAGIDLGQNRIHAVVLDKDLRLLSAMVIDVGDIEGFPLALSGAQVVAIDAPSALSIAPHIKDTMLSPKFRVARCAELALGRAKGIWVPWVTPTDAAKCPPWMSVGFRVYEVLGTTRSRLIEVYPHAGFRTLASGKVPSKTTAVGLQARVELLTKAGVRIEGLEMWSHDSLDACVAALTARDAAVDTAEEVTCGHDDSAIWLPGAGLSG